MIVDGDSLCSDFSMSAFILKELEQMAKERDKESEKQALLQEVENHKKQMFR